VYFFRALRSRDRKGKNETPFLVGYFRWYFWFLGSARLIRMPLSFLFLKQRRLAVRPEAESLITRAISHVPLSDFNSYCMQRYLRKNCKLTNPTSKRPSFEHPMVFNYCIYVLNPTPY
jgi:hypothetical protein